MVPGGLDQTRWRERPVLPFILSGVVVQTQLSIMFLGREETASAEKQRPGGVLGPNEDRPDLCPRGPTTGSALSCEAKLSIRRLIYGPSVTGGVMKERTRSQTSFLRWASRCREEPEEASKEPAEGVCSSD